MAVNASVEETIKKIVMKIVRKPDMEFTPTATFKDLKADSLDVVQILVAIEDTYEIEVNDEEMKNLSDMGSFVAYIEQKIAEKNK
ncbi:MAG: acyl carrier protein [Dehalococcoidales bacterium]|nr:acyl carrier protein [Dehalococcoidales bacterium]